jgi:hypothetical protein
MSLKTKFYIIGILFILIGIIQSVIRNDYITCEIKIGLVIIILTYIFNKKKNG